MQMPMSPRGALLEFASLLVRMLVLSPRDHAAYASLPRWLEERVRVLVLMEAENPSCVHDGGTSNEARRGEDQQVEGARVAAGGRRQRAHEDGSGAQRAQRRLDAAHGAAQGLVHVNLLELKDGNIEAVEAEP